VPELLTGSFGKLPLARPPRELIPEALRDHDVQYHGLQDEEIWHLEKLPALHRDPFDRLLIAHALCEGLRVVSPDPWIARYPVPVLW
jgi:PIN domain nuclease of toxin-antitoxin system